MVRICCVAVGQNGLNFAPGVGQNCFRVGQNSFVASYQSLVASKQTGQKEARHNSFFSCFVVDAQNSPPTVLIIYGGSDAQNSLQWVLRICSDFDTVRINHQTARGGSAGRSLNGRLRLPV
jgi:hypothetical protein